MERTLATAAEAGIAYGITQLSSISEWWVVPIATILAAVKTALIRFLAKKP